MMRDEIAIMREDDEIIAICDMGPDESWKAAHIKGYLWIDGWTAVFSDLTMDEKRYIWPGRYKKKESPDV